MDSEDIALLGKIAVWTIAAMLIVVGFSWFSMNLQHDVLNPQIRQNQIDDPARTIANKQWFHSKLGEIIAADNNIIDALNAGCQSDCQLNGLKQIRSSAIADYNSRAGNPDYRKDLDPGMPAFISLSALPADPKQAVDFLQSEVNTLQAENR